MTEQRSIDQEFESQAEDFLCWELTNIPVGNIFYFIEKFWLIPALEDIPVEQILALRQRRERGQASLPF